MKNDRQLEQTDIDVSCPQSRFALGWLRGRFHGWVLRVIPDGLGLQYTCCGVILRGHK